MKVLTAVYRLLFRRYRSLSVLCVILVGSLVSALSTGFWPPFRLAYVILLALPLSYVWARLSLWGVHAEAERQTTRLEQGQSLEERVFVHNRSWVSKLWLEVDDPSDLPGHVARRVVSLRQGQRRSWRVVSRCGRRGFYSLGPVTVTSGDPFGLFHFTKSFGRPQSLIVFPRALSLPSFHVPPAGLVGEGPPRRSTHHVTPNAVSVRPYAFGDSYKRIHWPSTARTSELMVKLFELDPASDVWLVLDLESKAHVGSGEESTEEYAVTIAASVAHYFARAKRPVGLVSFGPTLAIVPPERAMGHYVRLLEALALARASGEIPLAQLLDKEGKRFGRHSTVLVITPSVQESWVTSLQVLTGRGVKVAVILVEASTFASAPDSLVVFGTLAAAGIHTRLIKHSDDLIVALASGSGRVTAAGAASDRPTRETKR
jgi:uncharacterized protein (DUF58 family)